MRSKMILAIITLLLLVSASMRPVSAGLPGGVSAMPAAQSSETPVAPTGKCSDQKLIDTITADAKSIGDDLGKIPSTGAGGVYSIMINIANTRLKYEDLSTPTDAGCNYLVTETIILFANVEDLGLIAMGTKLGLDTTADQSTVIARVQKQVAKVNDLIGVPAAQ